MTLGILKIKHLGSWICSIQLPLLELPVLSISWLSLIMPNGPNWIWPFSLFHMKMEIYSASQKQYNLNVAEMVDSIKHNDFLKKTDHCAKF
jgi:hypothetical protein